MRKPILLPEGAAEAGNLRFVGWLCEGGARVFRGQAIAEIETDKTTVELEAPVDGVLVELTARAGDEIASEATLGYLEADPEP